MGEERQEMSPDRQMIAQGARRERTSLNLYRGGQGWDRGKSALKQAGHVLENFLTQTLPSGIDRHWLFHSLPTLRFIHSFYMWVKGPAEGTLGPGR